MYLIIIYVQKYSSSQSRLFAGFRIEYLVSKLSSFIKINLNFCARSNNLLKPSYKRIFDTNAKPLTNMAYSWQCINHKQWHLFAFCVISTVEVNRTNEKGINESRVIQKLTAMEHLQQAFYLLHCPRKPKYILHFQQPNLNSPQSYLCCSQSVKKFSFEL